MSRTDVFRRHAPREGWRTRAPSPGQPRVRPPREPRGYQGPYQPAEPPRGRPRGPRRAPSALRSSSRAGGTTRLGSRRARLGCQPRRWVAGVTRARGRIRRLRPRLAPYGGACWCARGAGRAFVRATASRAWTVWRRCGVGSRKRKRPTGLTPQHDENLTQDGAKIARLTARRIRRLIASVNSFPPGCPPRRRNSQRGAR